MRHLTVQQISASLDGALTGVSLELVTRHLATCHECRDRHARLAKQDDALRRLLAWVPSEQSLEDMHIRLEVILDADVRGAAPPPSSRAVSAPPAAVAKPAVPNVAPKPAAAPTPAPSPREGPTQAQAPAKAQALAPAG